MSRSAGKVMPIPRGPYDAKATYNILDLVTYDNKLWMARKSNIFGVLPSKDASEEWMLAVDGTTDVKGLETEVNAKFEEYDNKFTQLGEKDTSIEESITNLGEQITAVNDKFVFDTKPTKGSAKLVDSNGVYSALHYAEDPEPDSSGTYETKKTDLVIGWSAHLQQVLDQCMVSGSTKQHRTFLNSVNMQGTSVNIWSMKKPESDNNTAADDYFNRKEESWLTVDGNGEINLRMKRGIGDTYTESGEIRFLPTAMFSNDDASYDLGRSDYKFRNIYAQTGSIQTSDRNEKKDITDLVSIASENFIMGLNPVSYKFINGTSDRTHYGLIAQDVEELLAELGIDSKDFAGLIKAQKMDKDENPVEGEYVYGLRYDEFIAPLISMCQGLKKKNDELNDQIRTLQNAVAALQEKVGDM